MGEISMEKIIFYVQGSEKEPYKVTFWRKEKDFKSACSCKAGKKGMYCKHRLDLLEGNLTNLSSDNYEDLEKVYKMLENSDLGILLDEFLYLREGEVLYKKYYKMVFKTMGFEKKQIEFYTQDKIIFEKITIIKKGENCYFFDYIFNFLGWNKIKLSKIKKLYPDLELKEIARDKIMIISDRTNIEKAEVYYLKKEYLKNLKEKIKIAMR